MDAQHPNGFSFGKLTDLDWDDIEGYAAEADRDNGDVHYRGQFLCTAYNDADGGDIEDIDGNHMSDEQVQARINEIDTSLGQTGG